MEDKHKTSILIAGLLLIVLIALTPCFYILKKPFFFFKPNPSPAPPFSSPKTSSGTKIKSADKMISYATTPIYAEGRETPVLIIDTNNSVVKDGNCEFTPIMVDLVDDKMKVIEQYRAARGIYNQSKKNFKLKEVTIIAFDKTGKEKQQTNAISMTLTIKGTEVIKSFESAK